MLILVSNVGSSSYKYQIIDIETEEMFTKGVVERIANPPSIFTHSVPGKPDLKGEIDGEVAQLIHYERENQHNSRYSDYEIVDIADSAEFKNIMAVALGVRAIVDKVRELWMYGNTRIHIDNVTELGHFVELETVITNQTDTEARAEHNFVKQMLEIDDLELVSESYGDFMFSVK